MHPKMLHVKWTLIPTLLCFAIFDFFSQQKTNLPYSSFAFQLFLPPFVFTVNENVCALHVWMSKEYEMENHEYWWWWWWSGFVGSKAWKLVARIWVRNSSRILAIILVHTPSWPRKHGAIWRWGCEFKDYRFSHFHTNGEWTFCWWRLWKSVIFQKLASCGLG